METANVARIVTILKAPPLCDCYTVGVDIQSDLGLKVKCNKIAVVVCENEVTKNLFNVCADHLKLAGLDEIYEPQFHY